MRGCPWRRVAHRYHSAHRPSSVIRTRATSIILPPGDHALGFRRRKPGADKLDPISHTSQTPIFIRGGR